MFSICLSIPTNFGGIKKSQFAQYVHNMAKNNIYTLFGKVVRAPISDLVSDSVFEIQPLGSDEEPNFAIRMMGKKILVVKTSTSFGPKFREMFSGPEEEVERKLKLIDGFTLYEVDSLMTYSPQSEEIIVCGNMPLRAMSSEQADLLPGMPVGPLVLTEADWDDAWDKAWKDMFDEEDEN